MNNCDRFCLIVRMRYTIDTLVSIIHIGTSFVNKSLAIVLTDNINSYSLYWLSFTISTRACYHKFISFPHLFHIAFSFDTFIKITPLSIITGLCDKSMRSRIVFGSCCSTMCFRCNRSLYVQQDARLNLVDKILLLID